MSPQAIAAFNSASGTTVSELVQALILVLFVVVSIWAVLMFIGKMKGLVSVMRGDVDYGKFAFTAIRILAVMMVILILVH